VTRHDELARHIRRLGNHELNELLILLPKPRFAALVEVALARPVLPAGLVLRFEPAPGVDGWAVVACAPRRRLGTLTRDQDPRGRVVWRAWTRAGDPVRITGISCWRRRGDAAAALAWVIPVSGARCLALAAYVRALPDRRLHELLAGLPRDRFDRLLEAAFAPRGDGRMTAIKRCPRCGQAKAADQFYRRNHGRRMSPYCQPCTRAAAREARRRGRRDPASAKRLRAVDRARQRRHRALGRQGGAGR
jgi:hypothetical protein